MYQIFISVKKNFEMIDNEKWQIMVENHLEKGYILYIYY